MKSEQCDLCTQYPLPRKVSNPRKCAFGKDGAFQSGNWNCATMGTLRDIACKKFGEFENRIVFACRDDSSAGSLGIVSLPDDLSVRGYLVMNWYKDRGRTDRAYIMNEDEDPRPITLKIAEEIIDRWRTHA
jgi:hypothetical protein